MCAQSSLAPCVPGGECHWDDGDRKEFNSVRYWRSIMTQSRKLRFFPIYTLLLLMVPGWGSAISSAAAAPATAARESNARRNVEESQALVLLRGLPTLNTAHSIAIVELNPEAK